ncbi:MAG: DUF2461 family protein [Algoriphagus aquaeductus]|uniref:DUF2461 family protein n=1 Tax=Algoriphagus aquaeductus TaxID=475299 RepID=UPI00391AE64A
MDILKSHRISDFGEIQGEKIKKIPEEFKKEAAVQPLMYHTTFLAMIKLPATETTKPVFVDQIIGLYQLTLPLAKFLSEPFQS